MEGVRKEVRGREREGLQPCLYQALVHRNPTLPGAEEAA